MADYLDELERERAAQAPPTRPPLTPGYPTGQVAPGVMALQYATPQATSQVRAIGLAQRRIMWVILAALLLTLSFPVGGYLVSPMMGNNSVAMAVIAVFALGRLAILAMMMIGVFQLATALGHGMVARILFLIAMFVPLVNLIVLLSINGQATRILRHHNIRVGLMGPRVADLPAA
jgi:hypothetical protein